MKPSEALRLHRTDIQTLTQQFRLKNPRVFGSVLMGTDTESSDLDLLVDATPGTSLFDICGLQIALEERLGIRVDVLTVLDLPRAFRDRVVLEAASV